MKNLFLAVGLVFASVVFTRTWIHLRESQVITVTGSSHRNVRSDLVVWNAVVKVEASTIAEAHGRLERDFGRVKAFLEGRGLKGFSIGPVRIKDVLRAGRRSAYGEEEAVQERVGYQASQSIQVTSADVDLVPKIAADAWSLMADGVALETDSIDFVYTKAGDTKVQMMAEATEDARRRADEIAGRGGRRVRELRSARVGVVQINPLYSTATSSEGNNDTSTIEKTITATVSAEFTLR